MTNSNKGDNFRSGQGQNNKQKYLVLVYPLIKFPNQNKTHKRKIYNTTSLTPLTQNIEQTYIYKRNGVTLPTSLKLNIYKYNRS